MERVNARTMEIIAHGIGAADRRRRLARDCPCDSISCSRLNRTGALAFALSVRSPRRKPRRAPPMTAALPLKPYQLISQLPRIEPRCSRISPRNPGRHGALRLRVSVAVSGTATASQRTAHQRWRHGDLDAAIWSAATAHHPVRKDSASSLARRQSVGPAPGLYHCEELFEPAAARHGPGKGRHIMSRRQGDAADHAGLPPTLDPACDGRNEAEMDRPVREHRRCCAAIPAAVLIHGGSNLLLADRYGKGVFSARSGACW